MNDIDVHELKKRLDQEEKLVIIDVREEQEHQTFNIGGQLIPLGYLLHNIDEIEEHKDSEVIVYCRSGMRSATAKEMLAMKGFSKVRNLTGGVLAWISAFHN